MGAGGSVAFLLRPPIPLRLCFFSRLIHPGGGSGMLQRARRAEKASGRTSAAVDSLPLAFPDNTCFIGRWQPRPRAARLDARPRRKRRRQASWSSTRTIMVTSVRSTVARRNQSLPPPHPCHLCRSAQHNVPERACKCLENHDPQPLLTRDRVLDMLQPCRRDYPLGKACGLELAIPWTFLDPC